MKVIGGVHVTFVILLWMHAFHVFIYVDQCH